MQKRVFVSIPISSALQNGISTWREKYRDLPVRWLSGKNLHITLIPPWYEQDPDAVIQKLKITTIGCAPFDIEFKEVTYGPDPRVPRLIWAEGQAPQDIHRLKAQIEKILGRLPEKRQFKLHLTLARFRPENFAKFPEKNLNETVSWQEKIDSFTLMESHLSPAGADYVILEKIQI